MLRLGWCTGGTELFVHAWVPLGGGEGGADLPHAPPICMLGSQCVNWAIGLGNAREEVPEMPWRFRD